MISNIEEIELHQISDIVSKSIANRLRKMGICTVGELISLKREDYVRFDCPHPLSLPRFDKLRTYIDQKPEEILAIYLRKKDLDIPFSVDVPIKPEMSFIEIFRAVLNDYLSLLPRKMDKDIICRRYGLGEDRTYRLEEIGLYHGLSRERIRQMLQKNTTEIRSLMAGEDVPRIGRSCRPEALLRFEEVVKKIKSQGVISGKRMLHELDVDIANYPYLCLFLESHGASYLQYEGHDLFLFDADVSTTKLNSVCQYIMKVLRDQITSIGEFDLIVSIRKSMRQLSIGNELIKAICTALPDVELIIIDDQRKYQVSIHRLSSITDQGYRILYENGNSMHYKEIYRELVYRLSGLQEEADIQLGSMSPMLGLSDKLVPIGKSGKWALKEWGQNTSSIHNLIENVLQRENSPMTEEKILSEVDRLRPGVSSDSVKTLLIMKENLFSRLKNGQYILKVWEDSYADQIYRRKTTKNRNNIPSKKSTTLEDIKKTSYELVEKRSNKTLALAELVRILDQSYGYKKSTVYKAINVHPQLAKKLGPDNTTRIHIENKGILPSREESDADSEIATLIRKGENNEIEFKSSIRWDFKHRRINKDLEHEIAKTICAFGNTKGGKLLIGIDDIKTIIGLKPEYKLLGKKGNKDGFLLRVTNLIKNYLGNEYLNIANAEIRSIEDRDICLITVKQSKKTCICKNPKWD